MCARGEGEGEGEGEEQEQEQEEEAKHNFGKKRASELHCTRRSEVATNAMNKALAPWKERRKERKKIYAQAPVILTLFPVPALVCVTLRWQPTLFPAERERERERERGAR